jgi:hypothetical protein
MIAPVFGLFHLILFIAVFVFWIWMLIDCLQNPRLQGTDKLAWVLVVLFLHVLGAAIYYFIGREQRVV